MSGGNFNRRHRETDGARAVRHGSFVTHRLTCSLSFVYQYMWAAPMLLNAEGMTDVHTSLSDACCSSFRPPWPKSSVQLPSLAPHNIHRAQVEIIPKAGG